HAAPSSAQQLRCGRGPASGGRQPPDGRGDQGAAAPRSPAPGRSGGGGLYNARGPLPSADRRPARGPAGSARLGPVGAAGGDGQAGILGGGALGVERAGGAVRLALAADVLGEVADEVGEQRAFGLGDEVLQGGAGG